MYGKSDQMPKGIIKHNQKLRRDVEKAKRHFMRAAETIKNLKVEGRAARLECRHTKLALAKADQKIEKLKEYKILYRDLIDDHATLQRRYSAMQKQAHQDARKRLGLS
jgi:hypothetical protein